MDAGGKKCTEWEVWPWKKSEKVYISSTVAFQRDILPRKTKEGQSFLSISKLRFERKPMSESKISIREKTTLSETRDREASLRDKMEMLAMQNSIKNG